MGKLKSIYPRVKKLLEDEPKYRDNDEQLVSRIWWEQLKKRDIDPDRISATSFMRLYFDEKILTPADIITRARRRINEKHAETQGKSYKPRKKNVKNVQREVRELV